MKRHCQCPSPPGGSVTCDAHQVAYCKVVAGIVSSGCLTPPEEEAYAVRDPERNLLALLRWTLDEIDFSMTGSDFADESLLDVLIGPGTYTQWLDQIRAGTPLQLEGWVRVNGEFQPSKLAIRVPEQYGDPRQVEQYGYAPA